MLNLVTTTDKIQLVTSSAATIDVHASWADLSGSTVTPGRTNTAIASATTSDIVAAPASSTYRNVKTLHVRNHDSALSCDVTVIYDQNGTDYELFKTTLRIGDSLEYVEGVGFYVVPSAIYPLTNQSSSSASGFSSDTYLVGSAIALPSGLPVAGTSYRLRFDVAKTGAGIAPIAMNIRYGTAATTADTSRVALAFGTATGVADTGIITVFATFRSVGSGSSAVLVGWTYITTTLASTGLTNVTRSAVTVSGGFDSTPSGSFIGLSYNGGASAVHTIQQVSAELIP